MLQQHLYGLMAPKWFPKQCCSLRWCLKPPSCDTMGVISNSKRPDFQPQGLYLHTLLWDKHVLDHLQSSWCDCTHIMWSHWWLPFVKTVCWKMVVFLLHWSNIHALKKTTTHFMMEGNKKYSFKKVKLKSFFSCNQSEMESCISLDMNRRTYKREGKRKDLCDGEAMSHYRLIIDQHCNPPKKHDLKKPFHTPSL